MNTTELTERLREATDGLDVPPNFADVVLRGGHRRVARRRLAVAASVVVVAAVAASATVEALRDDPVPVADARLTMPTKGDLATERDFLDKARQAWQDGLSYAPEARDGYYDDRRGEPHVYWAGDTPAGPAAIVLQPVYVHRNAQVGVDGPRTAEGLVAHDPGDGRLKLVGTRLIDSDLPGRADYYRFGEENRTLLLVDDGEPLHWGTEPEVVEVDTGLELRYDWRRAEPRDGVALVTVPAADNPNTVAVYEGDDPPDVVAADDMTYWRVGADTYLARRLTDPSYRLDSSLLPWGDEMWQLGEPLGLSQIQFDARWGKHADYPSEQDFVVSPWTIVAGLPDGRVVILKEQQKGSSKPRLVGRVAQDISSPAMEFFDGGTVDRDAVLPVRFHIPGDGGWIVADRGKELRYRTSPEAQWQKAGRDAALLPANATEVLVDDLYVRL